MFSMNSVVFWMVILALFPASGFGGDEAPLPVTTSPAPKGPRVEISLADGRAPYSGILLSFSQGILDVQTDAGEHRQEQTGAVKSVHFMPFSLPTAVLNSPGPAPKRSTWLPADGARFRLLWQKEHDGTATLAEDDEYKKLRERAPSLALVNAMTPLQRMHMAERVARTEFNRGRLGEHIAITQQKLKRATTEEEALAGLWMLACSYRVSGNLKMTETLRADAATIASVELRKSMIERVPEVIESMRLLRLEKGDPKK